MKKLLVILGCGLILLGLGYSQRATIAERLLAAGLPKQMGTNQVELWKTACTSRSVARAARCPHLAPRARAWWW